MRKALVMSLIWFACSDPARPSPRLPGSVEPKVGPEVVKRVVIAAKTRKSGTYVTTTAPDGTITTALFVLENGRGPKVDATLRLGDDGSIASLSASGKHTFGTPVAETFAREGGRAIWKSEEEHGDRAVTGTAFFMPFAEIPDVSGWLVRAALRSGGKLPLLPAGTATVEKIGEVSITAAGATRKLTGYAITGLELTATYTWMNEDGSWFGDASPWRSIVPEGWEAAIEPLIARQEEVSRARDATLAATHAHRPPAAGLAYTHGKVLDVEKGAWIADQTVVVVGDTIQAIGPTGKVAIPPGAEVVDLAGRAVMPGLVDMHAHLGAADPVLDIASGVTMVRDVGNDPDKLDDAKARFDRGAAIGPHVVRFGFIEGRNEKAAASKVTAETVDEAKAAVEYFAKRGYEGIKIYNSMKPELVPVLAELAHARGMQVTGHIPVHMLANEAVRAGYDGIEHVNMLFLNFFATHDTDTRDTTRFTLVGDRAGTFDLAGKPMIDFIELLRQKKTVIDPTVGAFEDLFVGEAGKITRGLEDTVARLPVLTQRIFLVGGLPVTTAEKRAQYLAAFDALLAMVKTLHAAGIPVVLGTDNINGLMLHHEMALFARAGLPPATILRMATIGAARALRLDAKVGTIARGKRADLAILDGDPLADIRAIGSVTSTMRAGVVYPSAPLFEAVGVRPYTGR